MTETVSQQIGPQGATVSLSGGARIVFAPQALGETVQFRVSKLEPSSFFEQDTIIERIVLRCSGTKGNFNAPVKIEVPLPGSLYPGDSGVLIGGYLEEETGFRTLVPCSVVLIDGAPWGVMNVAHFSTTFLEWLSAKVTTQRPPPSAGPLAVPYYSQGESDYCWAASLHMVTQFAAFTQGRNIPQIIGEAKVSSGGASGFVFRTGSAIATITKKRTGISPERVQYDFVNYDQARYYLKRELGLRGIPVAFHFTPWSHVVVVVGYRGDTFIVHDPASTSSGAVGYKEVPWSEIAGKMGLGHNMTFLSIPKRAPSVPGITLNILPNAFQFFKAPEPQDPSRIFRYSWDYRNDAGFSLVDIRDQRPVDILPASVERLSPNGPIEVVNSSLTETRQVSVWMEVVCLAEKGYFHSQARDLTLPPNSSQNVQFDDVAVDKFRYRGASAVEYALVYRVHAGSVADEQVVNFRIAPKEIAVDSVRPDSAGKGSKVVLYGRGFGSGPRDARVTFSGRAAQIDTVSWSDTAIAVIVPDDAVSGPLLVTIGENKSKPTPFTVTRESTMAVPVAYSSEGSSFGDVVLSVTGETSVTGEILESFISDKTNYYTFTLSRDRPSAVSVTVGASLDKNSIEQEWGNKGRRVLLFRKPEMRSFLDTQYENFPVQIKGSFPHTVESTSISFTFKQRTDAIHISLEIPIYYDEEIYDSSGVLLSKNTGIYYNARTAGIVSIDCK